MHAAVQARLLPSSARTVTNLLDRDDALVALSVLDVDRLRRSTRAHGRVILALDGLQPAAGHAVLWVLRDCLSGEILLVRSLLSATEADLAARKAVARVFPDVPHQLCHCHYLREAAKLVFAADRHAKKEVKQRVRGIRPIERAVEERDDGAAAIVRGYAVAVRSALTDAGHPPLDAPGRRLQERLTKIVERLQRGEEQGAK